MHGHDEDSVDAADLDPAEVIGPPRMEIARAEGLLATMEQNGPKLPPKDCIALFASVAELRFTDWDKVEILWTVERKRKVDKARRDLYRRLQTQVSLHSTEVLDRVEAGIRDLIESTHEGLRRHEEIRRTYSEPWDYNTSYEFLSDVIFWVDTLGYVLELLRDLRVDLREPTTALVKQLDGTLESSLPGIAEQYRAGGDSIDPVHPDMFPKSFWWRRLPGARPIE